VTRTVQKGTDLVRGYLGVDGAYIALNVSRLAKARWSAVSNDKKRRAACLAGNIIGSGQGKVGDDRIVKVRVTAHWGKKVTVSKRDVQDGGLGREGGFPSCPQ